MKCYVTPDDFLNYWGINLRNLLRSNDNISNQAESFLMRAQDRLENWINNNTFRRLRFDCLTPYQMENFQKAILTQAMYMIKNGDLGIESGYDAEKGVIVERGTLIQLNVSPAAIDYLSNAGLFNLNIINKPRFINGYPGMEFANSFDGGGGPAGVVPCPPQPSPSPCPTPTPAPVPKITGVGYSDEYGNTEVLGAGYTGGK